MNRVSGMQNFPDTTAAVFSDGTVQWMRVGFIEAFCTFVGLRRMPFDSLGCQLHFGGSLLERGALIRYELLEKKNWDPDTDNVEFILSRGMGLVATYEQSYTDFEIIPEKMSCDYFNGNPGFNFHCEIFFQRASNHYLTFILLPNIIFTIMSFAQFLLDLQGGDRLSYSVTILLILVAQSLVASSYLPVCRESLW